MQNQLITTQENSNSVALYNQTLEQFKSLFYIVKGKRDTQIKLYSDNKTFNRESIIELNEKIQDKLLLHSITNKITNITVVLSSNKIMSYGNWQEFLNEKWNTSDTTNSITINWEFEVVLPNREHNLPQTHSLKVRFGQDLKPSEFLHLMMISGDEVEVEESEAQMVAKVDFVNATIATELLEKVNEWYKSLPKKIQDNNINNIISNNSQKLTLTSETLIILSGLALFYPIAIYLLSIPTNLSSNIQFLKFNFYIVSGVFLTFTVFTRLGHYFTRKLYIAINNIQGTPLFEFTKGDKIELQEIISKNKSIRNEIYLKLFVTLISTGILYFLGYLIKTLIELYKSSSS